MVYGTWVIVVHQLLRMACTVYKFSDKVQAKIAKLETTSIHTDISTAVFWGLHWAYMRCWISCCCALQMSSGKTCWRGNGPAASLVGCLFLFCGWTGGLAGPLSCFSTWNWRKTLTKTTNQPLVQSYSLPFCLYLLISYAQCPLHCRVLWWSLMSLVPILITLKTFRPWTTTKYLQNAVSICFPVS